MLLTFMFLKIYTSIYIFLREGTLGEAAALQRRPWHRASSPAPGGGRDVRWRRGAGDPALSGFCSEGRSVCLSGVHVKSPQWRRKCGMFLIPGMVTLTSETQPQYCTSSKMARSVRTSKQTESYGPSRIIGSSQNIRCFLAMKWTLGELTAC